MLCSDHGLGADMTVQALKSDRLAKDIPNTGHDSQSVIAFLRRVTGLGDGALDRAAGVAAETGERVETVLTRLGLLSEQELAETYTSNLGLTLINARDLPDYTFTNDNFALEFLKRYQMVPISEETDELTVAMVHPLDQEALDAVRFATGKRVAVAVLLPRDFEQALARTVDDTLEGAAAELTRTITTEDIERLKDSASEAPIIRLVNQLIAKAVEARASDIHIEPLDSELRVRLRIDGVLQTIEPIPAHLGPAIVSRIKVMAKLNIAEHRIAQDGRIGMAVRGHDIDFRVATMPIAHGEAVVLRILDRNQMQLNFAELGLDAPLAARVHDVLEAPHGIVLVTGPTGSGKTTTLYTALLELNTPTRKILTIEDPIEYKLSGINQVQLKPQIGLTFPNALRSFLRHDPDIMMIGEIRDLETAQIAVQAALTGHLILSTLHTNDAAGAVTRLLDMGVEDYLITSTLTAVIAQRLVRRLCRDCRKPAAISKQFAERLGFPNDAIPEMMLYQPMGCPSCRGTGYRGREAILEILVVSDAMRRAILAGTDAATLQALARKEGMQTLYEHGLSKALAGHTSLDEVLRVAKEAG